MDIETTLSTVAAYIPEEMRQAVKHASSYLPMEVNVLAVAQFILYFAAATMILGVVSRVVLGKRSSLNRSLSSSMGILFIYALTAAVYTFKPWNLHAFLSPLPFVRFTEEYLFVLPISDAAFPVLCSEILALIMLAFLVNLMDTFIPGGKSTFGWFFLRFTTMILSMILHLFVRMAWDTYLPDVLAAYAPMILLILLIFMMLSGILNLILGLVIAVSNPFLGAMYTFFFSSIVGKQLSKAVFSSGVVCVVFYLLDLFGYTVINITAAALMAYIPLAIAFLGLWYLVGRKL